MSTPTNHAPTHFWKQQSPINLQKAESLFVSFPKSFLEFEYRDAPFAGRFEGENGHENFVLTKPHPGKIPPMLKCGEIEAELIKIHLHTRSEHDLESADLDGEIHFIHRILNPLAGSELLVIGVFFDQSAPAVETDIFNIWAKNTGKNRTADARDETFNIDPRNILPETSNWYRYEGSLTSEPYSEVVSWLVFVDPIGVGSEDFKTIENEAHQPERPVQPINRRFVIRNFQ